MVEPDLFALNKAMTRVDSYLLRGRARLAEPRLQFFLLRLFVQASRRHGGTMN